MHEMSNMTTIIIHSNRTNTSICLVAITATLGVAFRTALIRSRDAFFHRTPRCYSRRMIHLRSIIFRFVLLCSFTFQVASAFTFGPPPSSYRLPHKTTFLVTTSGNKDHPRPQNAALRLDSSDSVDGTESAGDSVVDAPSPPQPVEPPKPYPIDIPSPILLSTSMVLAIASTGSLFELLGGTPSLGVPATAAIAVIGLPSSAFLFYASILKATAETEEDDKQFLGKR